LGVANPAKRNIAMGKNDKKIAKAPLIQPPVISRRGWKIVGLGIFTVVVGFIVLSFADSRAENWAGRLSPFVIIAGYALIGFGIVTRDPSQPS
jgi:hypothetical protein